MKITNFSGIRFPAEWERQSFIQLTWPHPQTDWLYLLDEVEACYVKMARTILMYEDLLVVCADEKHVREKIAAPDETHLFLYELPSNDTWARDHGGISVYVDGKACLYDFGFNAWGEKFKYDLDNEITFKLFQKGAFQKRLYMDKLHFILEGGSLESDGQGTLLTTESCLLSAHRNGMSKIQIETYLKAMFGLQQICWIQHSYLEGDDTDGHIDMLARFCSSTVIAYVAPALQENDSDRVQQASLRAMELELQSLRQLNGDPYQLVPLPFPDAIYEDGERLPASYANFLIINTAVLVPLYRVPQDEEALSQLRRIFPDREVVGIDCRVLIRQHGSLHCSTMQYPMV